MAYGIIKVDNITFDNGGSDQNVTVSGLYRATTSGVTVSGTVAANTVSGITVIGSTTVSGATVTGTTANFTSGNFSNLNSAAATVSGSLVMTNQQQVRFREAAGNGVNYIALQAPASVTSDKIITLPDVTGTAITTGDNGTVTSLMIADGTIVNADINASAAIALSKLATGALPSGITVASANIVDGTIVNADINASAAIVDTKLDTIATAGKVSNSATTATDANTASAIVARSAEGNFNITSINNGPLAGFRNAIINGNFDIWQRGTSFTAGFAADRWLMAVGGSSQTTSRQSFVLGQTDVPGEPMFFCRNVVSSVAGAANSARIIQRVEGARTFAGQQITASFWAKADATKSISFELGQDFGSGGSPSAGVPGAIVSKVSLTTQWQKFVVTGALPSISGKTLGLDGNSFVNMTFWFDAGSDFNARTDSLGHQSGTFDIAQVQVEAGPVATPFERRPIGTELALCQRYFQILPAMQGAMDATNATLSVTPMFQVALRGAPTYVLQSGTNVAHHPGSAFRNITSISGDRNTLNATLNVAFGANIPGQIFAGAVTASAEL
jgi:hypothetical protein